MRLTQGTFSFLPDLSDEQIRAQVEYCLRNDWAISIESTDDPHPRNTYWTMWGLPMFDSYHSGVIMEEIKKCRDVHPREYIRVNAFDSTRGWETVRLSFIVNRPQVEPGFELVREEGRGRTIHYTLKRRARSERR